ncbi:Methyl-accepting chemotaxis protein [Allopseudospirillum japonicum]|uniref:Methyl-accepting chemotaxis protein n=1 Tax=Allopseudospirillum japonicum TaxID=64971 RepID=A0A1H6U781_9GAMM|nr:methyl-accepting chemotaxis protein [Allopseudospirillum japonicum]SEI84155.1 Methyl-accepting chemotaxis protein [Allopseudospirillum japonicum]
MIEQYKQVSLAAQLTWVISILMISAGLLITFSLTQKMQTHLSAEAKVSLQQQSATISEFLAFYHHNSLDNAQRLSDIFFNLFPQGVSFSDQQVRVGQYQTSALVDESGIINNDFTKVDRFTRMTGGTATVFARYQDDFLRISTSLKKQDGQRALGTLLGKTHPGYQALIKGKVYQGVAHLFGRDYMTIYRPIQDERNNTIAILYIGFDLTEGLKDLRDTLTHIQVGETGYATILAGRGHTKAGEVLMHPQLAGKSLTQVQAADASYPFTILLEQQKGTLDYPWQDTQGKIAAYQHIPGWNWVILLGSFADEFAQTSQILRNTLILFIGLSTLSIIVISAWIVKQRLVPLAKVTRNLTAIGEGRLNIAVDPLIHQGVTGQNEVLHLRQATYKMHSGLRDLVTCLEQAAQGVQQEAQQVRQASHVTEEAAHQQTVEIRQLVTAMDEMTATTNEVAENARSAALETQTGSDKAAQGQQAAHAIHDTLEGLTQAMHQASQLIQEVANESNNISGFMSTISEVAEQTNLLALNAAIEAARAGESGRGFAVVADEVRALAGRTQEATAEIHQLVGHLQEKIDAAVTAIEQGDQAAKLGHQQAQTAKQSLTEISQYMHEITDHSTCIASAAEQQAAVAETVSQSLQTLYQLSEQSVQACVANTQVSIRLDASCQHIHQQLARFQL